ncbi:hypothetical protein SEVIR_2G359500v4 [Setaria viridis]
MCSSLPLIIGGDLLDVKKPGAIPRRTPRNRNNASTKRKASEREGKGEVQEAEEEVMAAAAEELSTAARSSGGGPLGTEEEEEERRRGESESEGEESGMAAVLDFDMLCASVALSAERRKGAAAAEAAGDCGGGVGGGGVQRMWEGDVVLDCLEDRRIALEAACCPCYRFGKNMRRANLGSCFLQGMFYFVLLAAVLVSLIAFSVTKHHIYLYMGLASVLLVAIYTGYFRRRIRKQFNIRGTESSLDDCVLHLICPCCTLCQVISAKAHLCPQFYSLLIFGNCELTCTIF